MDETINKILETAGLTVKQKAEFKVLFHQIILKRIIVEVASSESPHAQRLLDAVENMEASPENVNKLFDEISEDEKGKQIIQKAINETALELLETISKSATSQQKEQISTFLTA